MRNNTKCFDILAISLNVLHNYFDDPTKFIFKSILIQIFRYFNKTGFFLCGE